MDVPCLMVLDSLEEESRLWDLLPRKGLCQVRFRILRWGNTRIQVFFGSVLAFCNS